MTSDLTWFSPTTKVETWIQGTKCFLIVLTRANGQPTIDWYPIWWSWCHGKGKPHRSPEMGKPVCCWVIVWLPAISCPMCYVWLLLLSRWRRDRNAVMTNGRLERFIGQLSMFFLTHLSFRKSLIHLGNKYHLYHPAESVISSPCFILGCRLDL